MEREPFQITVQYTPSAVIRAITPSTIVRRYVGFVHVINPYIFETDSHRYMTASVSNHEGLACNIVSVDDDIEKFTRYLRENKVICAENLLAIPPVGVQAIYYGRIELMPFGLVLGKDTVVHEFGNWNSLDPFKIVVEEED